MVIIRILGTRIVVGIEHCLSFLHRVFTISYIVYPWNIRMDCFVFFSVCSFQYSISDTMVNNFKHNQAPIFLRGNLLSTLLSTPKKMQKI